MPTTLERSDLHPAAWVYESGDGLTLVLRESSPGAGDWEAAEVTVRQTASDAWLTATFLRQFPYARHLQQARELIRAGSTSSGLIPGNRPPASFIADRRGNKARPEEDWARLAYLWEREETSARRLQLPHIWADRYEHAVRTWQNHLSVARKKYVRTRREDEPLLTGNLTIPYPADHVGTYLTEEAWVLLYGDNVWTWMTSERTYDEAEDHLARRRPGATDAERARAAAEDGRNRRRGRSPVAVSEQAEGVTAGWRSKPSS